MNIHKIGNMMVEASQILLEDIIEEWPKVADCEIVIKYRPDVWATRVRNKHNKTFFDVQYGERAIENILSGSNRSTVGKEIERYRFMNRYENSLAMRVSILVCHEMAHIIQNVCYVRRRGEMHSPEFYNCYLRLIDGNWNWMVKYFKEMEPSLNKPTPRFATFDDVVPLLPNIRTGTTITFEYRNQWIPGKVIKCNPKTYTVETNIGKFRVPKTFVKVVE